MKTILSIFRDDIRSLSRRFFALAIIVAISFLPALYAWVNIYANGNPYANTGGIKIALASEDPGITLDDGSYVNMADEVFEEMKRNDKIGWEFPPGSREAVKGVKAGEYYAAIVFGKNFTYNMYNFDRALLDDKAPITYYENAKKNAVASKITETAASNLQESIKTKYLETVFSLVFDETNELSEELREGDAAEEVITQLEDLKDILLAYDSAISSFTANSSELRSGISETKKSLKETRKSVNASRSDAVKKLARAGKSVSALSRALSAKEKQLSEDISLLETKLGLLRSKGLSESEEARLKSEAKETAERIIASLEELEALFPPGTASSTVRTVRSTLETMVSDAESLSRAIDDAEAAQPLMQSLKKLSSTSLSSSIDAMIESMETALDQLVPLTDSMSVMLDDIYPVLDSADDTVDSLDSSLVQMQRLFRSSAEDLDRVIAKIKEAEEDEKIEMLARVLGGDPGEYAEFFSSLVDVDLEEVYSVASYGAAMAPFYSVLAIWVGGVILVSILKTHVDRKKYPEASESECFFGRLILFLLVGQAQTAVIVAGDIFLLGCAPVHPWLMWFSAAVTSLVFVLLIYSLTLSFGDIGKAMVVVVMVVQIAGSSGSYPIEILPPIFGKLYKFFPFPYAINAIREALSGTYGSDYLTYLGELLIFGVIGLAIGLLIRRPFIGLNSFVSEKIEETEVL